MAESTDSALSVIHPDNQNENKENEDSSLEPEKKKMKLEVSPHAADFKLEERLCGILCCAVCLDLPRTCYQVILFYEIFCMALLTSVDHCRCST